MLKLNEAMKIDHIVQSTIGSTVAQHVKSTICSFPFSLFNTFLLVTLFESALSAIESRAHNTIQWLNSFVMLLVLGCVHVQT